MSFAAGLLFATAIAPLAGDFDQDGLADRAFVRGGEGAYELVIARGTGDLEVVHTTPTILHFYLDTLAPGIYRTACAKGEGRRGAPCSAQAITLDYPAVQFGMEEASRAAAFWDRDHFEVVWLSD